MFQVPTVFILGAGASWHYGYPTGEELVKMVIARADAAARYFSSSMEGLVGRLPLYITDRMDSAGALREAFERARNEATELASRLRQVNPLVIDYFLGQNKSLQSIGTLLIAWVILECELNYINKNGNFNRQKIITNSPNPQVRYVVDDLRLFKDDWYRFIIQKLAIGYDSPEQLLKNKVHFVTFNYDVSLERALYKGLRSIEFLNPPCTAYVDTFLARNRIMHVYGKVLDNFKSDPTPLKWELPLRTDITPSEPHAEDYRAVFDAAYNASKSFRVIDPDNKTADADIINAAKEAIRKAKCVYILGYGFDKTNNDNILDLGKSLHIDNRKWVLFTNYNDSNRIIKRASRVMFGIPNQTFGHPMGDVRGDNHYFEMSTRDTYEALELDFDAPDDEPPPG